MALIASFAPSLRSGANDATRATNKQYALQKSSYCPIYTLLYWGQLGNLKLTTVTDIFMDLNLSR